jgi:hypothetical protein
MVKCLFDRDDHHRHGLHSFDGKPLLEVCIDADACTPVDAIGLVHAGHEEDQCDPRIVDEVLETIDFVVAAPIGDE